jgi:hypothetical protein
MNCPFCKVTMTEFYHSIQDQDPYTSFCCENVECLFCTMPRYKVRICGKTGEKLSEFIIMDNKFYVEIDFIHNTSKISKLDVCFKIDTIPIARALVLNLENYQAAFDKIKLLVTFS